MPHVPVGDDVELHFDDHGSGRPVVLIHGWPLSSRSWEPQVAPLVDHGYRVVSYDRRGFGASSQPWHGYDYDTFAADLDALLRHLDLTGVVLVGFSMGGGEVARFIARYGTDRVAGAVFAAAVPPYLHATEDNPEGGLDDATIEQFQRRVVDDRAAFLEGFTTDFMTAGDDVTASAAQLRYLRTIAEFASPKATLDCIAAFAKTDFRDDLDRIDVPTLVIHGDSDGVVPFEVSGRRTHVAVAHSRLVVVEGGPHGVNASHPEVFNAALLDFLAGVDRGPTGDDRRTESGAPVASENSSVGSGGRHAQPDVPADDAEPTRGAASDSPADRVAETRPVRGDAPDDDAVADGRQVPVPRPATADASVTAARGGNTGSALGLDDLVWRQAGSEDDDVPAERPGLVADPNLGDIPVDDQPRPRG